MQTIYLYNEEFTLVGRVKAGVKRILHRQVRGPAMVFDSLCQGLTAIGQDYRVNARRIPSGATVCVLSGIATLRWAFTQKQRGRISKLIAGPNIAMPNEYGGIIFDPAIDRFLVPSQWVLDFCLTYMPTARPRIVVWAAGVPTLPLAVSPERSLVLVYQKNASDKMYNDVLSFLNGRGIASKVYIYGTYARSEYLADLSQAHAMIVLSTSESQGLAVHEAWMMNVPTLVWGGGNMEHMRYAYVGSSPAPYLTDQCGMIFADGSDLPAQWSVFWSHLDKYAPRNYHLHNFTPEAAARKFLAAIT